MSTGFIATVTIACVLFVVFMVLRLTVATKSASGGVASMFAKTAASLGFIAIAIAGLYEGAEDFRAALFVLAGLVFGLIGDMVLDLKVVYLEKPEEGVYLTGGMVSFGVGHIMYLTAVCLFVGEFVTDALIGGCVAVAAVLACATVFGGAKLMKLDFGKFRIHSLLYAFILMFMSALSVGVCITMNCSSRWAWCSSCSRISCSRRCTSAANRATKCCAPSTTRCITRRRYASPASCFSCEFRCGQDGSMRR